MEVVFVALKEAGVFEVYQGREEKKEEKDEERKKRSRD